MTDSDTKTSKKPSKYDQAAILVAKDNPTLNNEQIGKKLVSLGISKNPKTIHDKWMKSDYLRREITEVRNQNLAEIQRKLVPKSIKKLNKLLHTDDDKLRLQAVNTTLKYGMGEPINTGTTGINIEHIDKIQIAISQDLAADLVGNRDQ